MGRERGGRLACYGEKGGVASAVYRPIDGPIRGHEGGIGCGWWGGCGAGSGAGGERAGSDIHTGEGMDAGGEIARKV